jgi:hypothetical protein
MTEVNLEDIERHCKCQPARQALYTGERLRRWKTALSKSPNGLAGRQRSRQP